MIQSRLSGNWGLDEGQGRVAFDTSGNNSNGLLDSTLSGASIPPMWITGRAPNAAALRFNGKNFVKIADSPGLELPTITVESWVRSNDPGNFSHILSKGADRCFAASYGLTPGSTRGLSFYVYPGLGSAYIRSPDAGNSVWDGTWHHIAGTFDESTVRLYVDGTQIGTGTTSASKIVIAYDLPFQDFYIGTYYGSCQLGFVGDISGVRIWNGAFSSNEVLLRAQDAKESPR